MVRPWKRYRNEVFGVWFAKWKEGKSWRTKQVPKEIQEASAADRWLETWWLERDLGPDQPSDTVRTLFLRWIEYLKTRPDVRAETRERAESTLRLWVEPYPLASVKVDLLKISDCVNWIEDIKAKGRASFTVRNVVAHVRTMLSDCRGKGWYRGENFFNDPYVKKRLKGAEQKAGKDTIVHLSAKDARKVVSYQGEAVSQRRQTKNVLAVCSAMRAGELAGLKWKDLSLDIEVPFVKVERQLTREGMKDPKRGSKRFIPLHPVAVAALKSWKKEGWREQLGRDPKAEDPVFAGGDGKHLLEPHALNFRNDLAAYKISALYDGRWPVTFHALRRTCLTLLTDAEVPEGDVKAIAGHRGGNVTRDHYVAKNLPRLAKAVARLPL